MPEPIVASVLRPGIPSVIPALADNAIFASRTSVVGIDIIPKKTEKCRRFNAPGKLKLQGRVRCAGVMQVYGGT